MRKVKRKPAAAKTAPVRRRPYIRESRYPAALHLFVEQSMLDDLESAADADGVSLSAAARAAIAAGLVKRKRNRNPDNAVLPVKPVKRKRKPRLERIR